MTEIKKEKMAIFTVRWYEVKHDIEKETRKARLQFILLEAIIYKIYMFEDIFIRTYRQEDVIYVF